MTHSRKNPAFRIFRIQYYIGKAFDTEIKGFCSRLRTISPVKRRAKLRYGVSAQFSPVLRIVGIQHRGRAQKRAEFPRRQKNLPPFPQSGRNSQVISALMQAEQRRGIREPAVYLHDRSAQGGNSRKAEHKRLRGMFQPQTIQPQRQHLFSRSLPFYAVESAKVIPI